LYDTTTGTIAIGTGATTSLSLNGLQVTAPTVASKESTTKVATTAYVDTYYLDKTTADSTYLSTASLGASLSTNTIISTGATSNNITLYNTTTGTISLGTGSTTSINLNGLQVTAPTVSTKESTTKVATTAYVNTHYLDRVTASAGILLNPFGYCTFLNGLIMQWGRVNTTQTADGASQTVTYPIPFPTQVVNIQITDQVPGANPPASNGLYQVVMDGTLNYSLTSVTVRLQNPGTTANTNGTAFMWLALGY
jgi:hypothetical protein